MTLIIMTGLENETFSFKTFYKRRAQRICPALLVVVLVTCLIGICILQADPYRTSLREAIVSLGFVSNFRFAKDVGYFDGGDTTHIFLHTWSLSVEWQFYIFYPLLLVAVKRIFGTKNVGRALIIATTIFVLISVSWTNVAPRQSYYLLPSRASELLVGSLAYFYPIRTMQTKVCRWRIFPTDSRYLEFLGLLLILLSVFIIDDSNGWPTVWFLLPMVATWLCIAANNEKTILRGSLFQKIGIWSYSIYLVHWPIVVFASAMGLGNYGVLWLIPILILGYCLHVAVEKRRDYGAKFALLYFLGALAVYNLDNYYVIELFDFDELSVYEKVGDASFLKGSTGVLGTEPPEFIIHGDSHALDLFMPLVDRKVPFVYSIATNCYSIGMHVKQNDKVSYDSDKQKLCNLHYQATKAVSDHYPDIPIIFVQRWTNYGVRPDYKEQIPFHITNRFDLEQPASDYIDILNEDFRSVVQDFGHRKVYVIGNKQENTKVNDGSYGNPSLLKHWISSLLLQDIKDARYDYVNHPVNEVLQQIIYNINNDKESESDRAKLIYIDPAVHCENSKCALFVNNDVQVYSDDNHYSRAGAERAVEHILNTLNLDYGDERTTFSTMPEPIGELHQKVLRYNDEKGFFFDN